MSTTFSSATQQTVRNSKSRQIIAVIQIILLVVAAFMPFIENMFIWRTGSLYGSYINISHMSLENLMTTQEIGAGPIAFYAFYVILIATILYCLLHIFIENPWFKKKFTIALPSLALILSAIMIFSADAYHDSFTYGGDLRIVNVNIEFPAYILLVVIAAVVLLEVYKQVKLADN